MLRYSSSSKVLAAIAIIRMVLVMGMPNHVLPDLLVEEESS